MLVASLRPSSPQACPLCRDEVSPARSPGCLGCETVYHQDCLTELGGCSTIGCARFGSPRDRAAGPVAHTTWPAAATQSDPDKAPDSWAPLGLVVALTVAGALYYGELNEAIMLGAVIGTGLFLEVVERVRLRWSPFEARHR